MTDMTMYMKAVLKEQIEKLTEEDIFTIYKIMLEVSKKLNKSNEIKKIHVVKDVFGEIVKYKNFNNRSDAEQFASTIGMKDLTKKSEFHDNGRTMIAILEF